MKITKVKIQNFKIIKDATIELSDFLILVGDNGTGKSTILEALHLALTGNYHGRSIIGNISSELFNKEVIKKYIDDFNNHKKPLLPEILIEIYFDDYAEMQGDNNSQSTNGQGFSFKIKFDEKYGENLKQLEQNELTTFPIELYICEWSTFSREYYVNSKNINYKSAYLESKVGKLNAFISNRLIKFFIDDQSKILLNQIFRQSYDQFNKNELINRLNDKIRLNTSIKNSENVSIGIPGVNQNSWQDFITLKESDISYENIGMGEQCFLNLILCFENDLYKNKSIILIEEPENHLSGTKLNALLSYLKHNVDLKKHQIIITTHSSMVLNIMGLDNLVLVGNDNSIVKLNALSSDTVHYFEKAFNCDTLRYVVSKKAILVEGISDSLIVQKAFLNMYDTLPIEKEIDIIETSLSFKRFLELGNLIKKNTIVIIDNDGNLEKIKKLKEEYESSPFIKIYSSDKTYDYEEEKVCKDKVSNLNTLEPEMFRANNLTILNEALKVNYSSKEDMLRYMSLNKVEVAWKIFTFKKKIDFPKYILKAISNE